MPYPRAVSILTLLFFLLTDQPATPQPYRSWTISSVPANQQLNHKLIEPIPFRLQSNRVQVYWYNGR